MASFRHVCRYLLHEGDRLVCGRPNGDPECLQLARERDGAHEVSYSSCFLRRAFLALPYAFKVA